MNEEWHKVRFNVGCGKRDFKGDWFHVDGADYKHIDSEDITLKYYPDNYIDLLYSSHLIAYFSVKEFTNILEGWYKKIKPGGTLRIATPDFDILSKMYQVGIPFERLVGPLYGLMKMNDKEITHKTCYDEKTLTSLLTDAGFVNIHRYDHKKTEHPNTGNREDFFDDHSSAYINGTLISLNMECNKP